MAPLLETKENKPFTQDYLRQPCIDMITLKLNALLEGPMLKDNQTIVMISHF